MLPATRSRLARATATTARRRLFCTSAASSFHHDPSAAATPPPPPPSGSALSKLLKLTLFAAVTGGVASTCYASYAYTLEEVDQKTRAFRAPANYKEVAGDDASTIDKIQASIRSKAMKASAEAVELYLDLRRSIEERVREFTEPSSEKLLPDMTPDMKNADLFTLVLDLSETLIYSDWKRERGWRTFKRPGVDSFLEQLAQYYEIVVYSDQLSTYVDEILERLDERRFVMHRLSRAATKYQDGKHYRDFSKLNRDPSRIIYVSAHALENALQPENSVQIKPWKPEDTDDTALVDLIPFLQCVAFNRPADIRQVIASYEGCDIAKEFIKRSGDTQRRIQEKKQRMSIWGR